MLSTVMGLRKIYKYRYDKLVGVKFVSIFRFDGENVKHEAMV